MKCLRMENYLTVARNVYSEAAFKSVGRSVLYHPVWQLPEFSIPKKMLSMNYGCATIVHPRDLVNRPTVLYVGIGGWTARNSPTLTANPGLSSELMLRMPCGSLIITPALKKSVQDNGIFLYRVKMIDCRRSLRNEFIHNHLEYLS